MELSLQITSALRLLGDSSKVENATYKEVLRQTLEDLLKKNAEIVDITSSFGEEAGVDVKVRCHAALATLFVQCVRGNHGQSVLASTLEDLSWPPDRVTEVTKELQACKPVLQAKLASLGSYPPHIVDIDWKLNYHVRSSSGEEGGGASYLITLHTEESEGRRGKVTFTCSLAQLTHLVNSLRQATRCIQKYASNS